MTRLTDATWLAEGRARKRIERWGSWGQMRAAFRWNIPEHFNIAERCCDSWAAFDPVRVALTHVAQDGTARTIALQIDIYRCLTIKLLELEGADLRISCGE